jgi:RNA polymerase sigma factor (sigma-70 family)
MFYPFIWNITAFIMKNTPFESNILDGNEDFLASIYNLYAKDLYVYGLSLHPEDLLVEDAIHDVFIDIYLHRENLREVRNIKFYLMSALQHRILFLLKKSRQYVEFTHEKHNEEYERDIQELWIEQEEETARHGLVVRLMSRLNSRQKEVVHLRLAEGLSFDEISQLMHINRQSAQNLFQRAINKLRKEFVP